MIVHHFTTPITTPFARKSTQIYGDLRRLWEKAKIKESAKKPEITGLCRLIKGYKIMIKVLFVCHGNICRSPMAEFLLKDMIKKEGLADRFVIASAGTSREEIGNPVHQGTRKKLAQDHISAADKYAVQLTKEDYEKYDLILGMDRANISNILRIIGSDPQEKVHRLLDFTELPRDIADPWYTGDFEITYAEIKAGCAALLKHLRRF